MTVSEEGSVSGGALASGPHLPRDNLLIDLDGLVSKEGWVAGCHLVDENPQGPPVHSLVVAFAQDDLRGQVLRGPTQGPGAAFHTLGKTKVCHLWAQEQGWQGGRDGLGHGHLGLPLAGPGGHLNVALLVDEKVLRLQVPVDEIKGVQVLEGQDDLGGVEAGMGLAGRDKWRGDG